MPVRGLKASHLLKVDPLTPKPLARITDLEPSCKVTAEQALSLLAVLHVENECRVSLHTVQISVPVVQLWCPLISSKIIRPRTFTLTVKKRGNTQKLNFETNSGKPQHAQSR